MYSQTRPTGVTILVALEAFFSILILIGGLALLAFAPFLVGMVPATPMPFFVPGLFAVIAFILIIMGVLGLVASWGLWTGQYWAWVLTFGLAILGIIGGIFSLPGGIVSLLINGLIAFYLWQPYVRAYYSQEVRAEARPPSVGNVIYCPNCGTPNPPDSKYCRKCGKELKSI